MIDCFIVSFLGATLYYARPDALKGTLVQTIVYAKPTIFLGVPRTWEKIEETIRSKVSKMSNTKQRLFNWATKNGLIYTNARFTGQTENRFKYWLANTLVLKKIRQQLGFDQARLIYSAAAPINRKTLEFIIGLGLPICEVYGMSESTGKKKTKTKSLRKYFSNLKHRKKRT
jgi:long-chain-fatty-acid--CoA ligase ACSBG